MESIKSIGRVSAFAVSAAMGTLVVGMIGTIVTYSVASTMIPAGDAFWGDLRCTIGVPLQSDTTCIQDQLNRALKEQEEAHERRAQEMTQKIAALEAEKAQLETARRGYEERLRTLEAIEARVSQFTLFTRKPWRDLQVTSGVNYTSFVKEQAWSNAYCYVTVRTSRGLPLHIELASQKRGAALEISTPEPAVLEAAGFTQGDIADARSLCEFPADTPI